MSEKIITFIGGGNMAGSLIGGLIAAGWSADSIRVSDPSEAQRNNLLEQYGVQTFSDNLLAADGTDIIVLAVKPQIIAQVAGTLSALPRADHVLFMSIAAGVREGDIQRWLGRPVALVRVMPNTPALVGRGMAGMHANEQVSSSQRTLATAVMDAVGKSIWVDEESSLDAVTAVSGSGPAYFFLLMELMQAAGRELGLSAEVAHQLATETALGAATMAVESALDPKILRENVTSPGGTTERAIEHLRTHQIDSLLSDALTAARDRAVELGDELGAQQ